MRLGDLDALKADLIQDYAYAAASMVDKQPTIDAVPVVHGRWIFDDYTKRLRCSECEAYKPYEMVGDIVDYWDCDYCPICGTRMDGEENV